MAENLLLDSTGSKQKVSCPLPPKFFLKSGQGEWNCIITVMSESLKGVLQSTTGHTEGEAVSEETEAWLHWLGNFRASYLMSLSLKNKVSNWLGGEGRKYLPLEVCPGVKMIVLNNFVYCQAYNSPSIDGGCFNMMLLMIILYFLASSLGKARMSTVQSTQEHFHQKPSLGITHEVRILFRTGFVDKTDYPCLKSHKRHG